MDDADLFAKFSDADNFRDLSDAQQGVALLRSLLNEGRGVAGFLLASLMGAGIMARDDAVREYLEGFGENDTTALYVRAFPLLLREAESGSVQAMNFLSLYYQSGIPPAPINNEEARRWDERADREWAKRKP